MIDTDRHASERHTQKKKLHDHFELEKYYLRIVQIRIIYLVAEI